MPVDFLTTARPSSTAPVASPNTGRLTTTTAKASTIAFIHLQKWLGVSHPINTAYDYVIDPLRSIPSDPTLTAALAELCARRSKTQQQAWTGAYDEGRWRRPSESHGAVSVPSGDYGPVAPMMASLLGLAQSGGVDGALLTSQTVLPNRLHQAAAVPRRRW